jgi:hypothetical protein
MTKREFIQIILGLLFIVIFSSPGHADTIERQALLSIQREAYLRIDGHKKDKSLFRAALYRDQWEHWDLYTALHIVFASTLNDLEYYQSGDKIIFHDQGKSKYVLVDDPTGEYFRVKPWNKRDEWQRPVPDLGSKAYDKDLKEISIAYRGNTYFQQKTHFNYAPIDEFADAPLKIGKQDLEIKTEQNIGMQLIAEPDPEARIKIIEKARWQKLSTEEENSLILYCNFVRSRRESGALLQLAISSSNKEWLRALDVMESNAQFEGPLTWTIFEVRNIIKARIAYQITKGRSTLQMRGFVKKNKPKDVCVALVRGIRSSYSPK